jgi:hypothetical protein
MHLRRDHARHNKPPSQQHDEIVRMPQGGTDRRFEIPAWALPLTGVSEMVRDD